MNKGLTFNKFLICGFAVLIVIFSLSSKSLAVWLIYHKPEFRGKIIDAETKEPIEDAVVVVVYKKHTLISGPGGGYSSIINIKETFTDKKGEFYFPSYTTIIQPLSIEDYVEFIIYKPGLKSYPTFGLPNYKVNPLEGMSTPAIEKFFSEETIGKQGEIKFEDEPWRTWKVYFGVVELPRLKTKEDRLRAIPGSPGFTTSKDLPLLYKAINEENKRFGLGEVK